MPEFGSPSGVKLAVFNTPPGLTTGCAFSEIERASAATMMYLIANLLVRKFLGSGQQQMTLNPLLTQNFLCGRPGTVSLAESPAPTQPFSSCFVLLSHSMLLALPLRPVECRSIVAARKKGHVRPDVVFRPAFANNRGTGALSPRPEAAPSRDRNRAHSRFSSTPKKSFLGPLLIILGVSTNEGL